MDDNSDRKLNKEEFEKGLSDYGVTLSRTDIDALFNDLDRDASGTIDFEEFLRSLRVRQCSTLLLLFQGIVYRKK